MPVLTNLDQAITRLKFELQADTPPILNDEEVGLLLEKQARATVWEASKAYAVGDIVIPATLNGHRFICVTAGASDSTEPTWTTRNFSNLSDGTVSWEEDGIQYDLWDMEKAVEAGWILKKAKAVVYIGSDDGLSEVYEHCKDMAERSKPLRMG